MTFNKSVLIRRRAYIKQHLLHFKSVRILDHTTSGPVQYRFKAALLSSRVNHTGITWAVEKGVGEGEEGG